MKEKFKKESLVINLSVLLSTIFLISEIIMAICTNSRAILIDCISGGADLFLIVVISFLLPLIYRPVSEKTPYGYSQIESIFIILKGFAVVIISMFLIKDSIEILLSGGTELDYSSIAIFELILGIFCVISYVVLKKMSKGVKTPVVKSDLIVWKIDMIYSFGMFLSFAIQIFLVNTRFSVISPYVDSVLAIIISLFMLPEPFKMIIKSFKNIILFAPEKETIEEIKEIVGKEIKMYPYEPTFYDVVKTGRKIWIEVYIKSENNMLNLVELKKAKKQVEKHLKQEFDEIYVELTPEL